MQSNDPPYAFLQIVTYYDRHGSRAWLEFYGFCFTLERITLSVLKDQASLKGKSVTPLSVGNNAIYFNVHTRAYPSPKYQLEGVNLEIVGLNPQIYFLFGIKNEMLKI